MQNSDKQKQQSSNKQSEQTNIKSKQEKKKEIQQKINNIIWKYLNSRKDIDWDYHFPPQEAY